MKSKIFLVLCFMLIIISIAGVSASEDINQASSITNDENPNIIGISVNDMDDGETVTSTSDVAISNQENNGNVWYVNGTQSGGDGSTPETAFNTFKAALTNENVADGDTIMVASGQYKGNGVNVGLTIDKELNIIKYGDDEAIFDGECKYQIFKITSTSININGLTFKNGNADKGGALYFYDSIFNSNINATYINNTANQGGAVCFFDVVKKSNITGTYINNTAKGTSFSSGGGANFFYYEVENTNISGTYYNNFAKINGGANYFYDAVTNVNFEGRFTLNKAEKWGGANFFSEDIKYSNIDGTYTNNYAKLAGGANRFDMKVSNTNITGTYDNNTAGVSGGANYYDYTIENSNISGLYANNNATRGGANFFLTYIKSSYIDGIYNNNIAENGAANYLHTITNTNVGGLYSFNSATENGGANFINEEIIKSNFTGEYVHNYAQYGGAIYAKGNTISSIFSANFYENNGLWVGAGIYFNCTVKKSNFTGIYTKNEGYFGPGICFGLNIDECSFDANFTYNLGGDAGGAICCKATASNCIFNGNYVGNIAFDGGALYIMYLKDSIIDANFTKNFAANYGGCLDSYGITNTNVTGWFFKNHGSDDAGVIHTRESMDNCNINGTFIENDGFYSGVFYFTGYVNNSNIDGVYINNTAGYGGVDIINSIYNSNIGGLYINNSAKNYYGGVHYLKEYNENCTFTGTYIDNHAKLLGGVFYIKNGLNNTVISGSFSNNTAGEYGNTIYVMGSSRDEAVDVNLTIRDSVFSGTNPIYTDNDLVNNTYINLINNKELDNDGDYFIYNQYNLNLFNNTLTTVIYNKGNITSPTNITIRDNTTEKVNSSLVNLYAKILDDNNNYIVEDLFVFTINDAIFETVFNKEGFVDANYVLKDGYGIYIINSTMDSLKNNKNYIAILIYGDKEFLNITASADPIEVGEDAIIIVAGLAEATGNVTATVNGEEYSAEIVDGSALITVPGLTENATALISYPGDDKYNATNTTVDIVVNPKYRENLTISAVSYPITVGEDAIVFVTGLEYATGNVDVAVNGENYTAPIIKGVASVRISGLTENVTALITYAGDDMYNNASTTVDIVVNPKSKEDSNITIDAPAEVTEGDNVTVTVTLSEDATGIMIIGNEVVDVVNGTASAVLTDLPAGNNTVSIIYSGDDKYNLIRTSVVVTVNAKPVPKENLTISAVSYPITVGEDAIVFVTGLEYATGNVDVAVNGENYTAPIIKGVASVRISGLTENVTALITYAGDDMYNNASTTVDIVVNPKTKENATMDIDVSPVTEGQNATIDVELPEDATGEVTATVDGKNYTVPVKDGKATITIPELVAGNYTVPVTYSGDDKYNPLSKEVNVTVEEDKSDIISAPDVTKYYGGSERFVVTVTDYQGNPLANKSVSIVINAVSYSRTTNENGTTSISLGLPAGVYNVTTTVDNTTIDSVVTILTTVNGTDIVKVFRNATQYYATFLDANGNYLAEGTMVRFNINGVMYDRKVSGDKGLAKLNINLEQGEYIITAMNLETGEMASNNITVIPRIVENNDLTKYYRNASQYTVKIIGDDGNPVGAGESVTFNINGVMYTRTTDASGIVKMNINLNPGDYIITAEYNNCKVSNNIKVLPILTGKDITMKYRDGTKFVATLVDGQGKPYAEQTIQFNINGVFYNRVTDSAGQAELNINLMAGEYIITSSYNGASTSNTIKITA